MLYLSVINHIFNYFIRPGNVGCIAHMCYITQPLLNGYKNVKIGSDKNILLGKCDPLS